MESQERQRLVLCMMSRGIALDVIQSVLFSIEYDPIEKRVKADITAAEYTRDQRQIHRRMNGTKDI